MLILEFSEEDKRSMLQVFFILFTVQSECILKICKTCQYWRVIIYNILRVLPISETPRPIRKKKCLKNTDCEIQDFGMQ